MEGLERIDASKPRLYAANHLSALDIPLLYAYLPFAFRIMAHRLVFRVPLIGWYLRRAGALEISPDSVALSRRALREAVRDAATRHAAGHISGRGTLADRQDAALSSAARFTWR